MTHVSLKKVIAGALASIERNTQYVESRFVIISIVAVIAFPLYYHIWHDLFPQPYENLGLRLTGSALFFPLIFVRYWPQRMRRYISLYWYVVTLYGLPFFFTFMLLMNGMTTIWLMSALIAVFLMIPIHNPVNFVVQFIIGGGAAALLYHFSWSPNQAANTSWQYLPVYLFAVVSGALMNLSGEKVNQERLRTMLATAGNIAHELRTPLLGIKSGAAGLRQYLPTLLEGYLLAKEHGLSVRTIRQAHLDAMGGVLARIEGEANHSNMVIDMLLMNVRQGEAEPHALAVCSMGQCVQAALERYPFSSEKERRQVVWEGGPDFHFRGNELLMVHVLFNLLKNALYHIAKAGKGKVTLRSERGTEGNLLRFRDTGSGIPPEVMPHIFTRFYSWSADRQGGTGSGVGLSFCRSVMKSFGGAITAESVLGEYTEFVLTFPFEETA